MNATIAGREYSYEVHWPKRWAPTAIVMPHAGSVALGQLAIDAVRKFTPEPHMIWVSHDYRDSAPIGDASVICRTPVDKWWQPRRNVAGYAAGIAYSLAVRALKIQPPKWVMFMHNDSMPLKAGWLSYLMDKARTTLPGIAGVKRTEVTHAAHSSGVLMWWHMLANMDPEALMANMPKWDILEAPSVRWEAWTARSACIRAGAQLDHDLRTTLPYWLESFACDVSWDDEGPFWVHLGGGTINQRKDIRRWITEARRNLHL